MRSKDKFRGCLIGGAAGDALGYPVEFLQHRQIVRKYGKNGITEYQTAGGIALISDDTQMTMFTVTGLLLGATRRTTRGIGGCSPGYISCSYHDWYKTQTECYPLEGEFHYSWLVNLPEMFSQRAPGNTCLLAIQMGGRGTIESPINQSKGCGGIMRVAPIGLYFNDSGQKPPFIDRFGAEVAALTHGHPLGYLPAAALVHILHKISEDEHATLLEAVLDAMEALQQEFFDLDNDAVEQIVAKMQCAVDLASTDLEEVAAIAKLGEGWIAEETLAIAIYCALKYEHDFDKALITAVNHGGDSDSTGAMTGSILGTYLGYDAIPAKYKTHLELHDRILELADDLHRDCQISSYAPDAVWEAKYVKMTYPDVSP
jgi:ADP-ribosylglycohydrolase